MATHPPETLDNNLPEGYHQMTNYGRARWHASQAQMHADRARKIPRLLYVASALHLLATVLLTAALVVGIIERNT